MNPGVIFSGLADSAAAWLVALLILIAAVAFGWHKGASSVRAEWEIERARAVEKAAEVKVEQAQTTTRVVTQYVDRIRTVRDKAHVIEKEIPVYVPDNTALPGGFRLFHDAAARGGFAVPAGSADAAPVAAQDLARTLAENYDACRQNAEQLSALQDWACSSSGDSGACGGSGE